ncbi:hypothetical protein CPLU01_07127 [Colletotrichum plurivorum]|uniref:Uncharacterized protein n=1 Tax=Colletotrichum plurivorum TaxID=2175906 RepID=A0A8H6KGB9_9PEZI|nr:hypothetical protein CPLU01_07127 [Colletotrichum plurivorum]
MSMCEASGCLGTGFLVGEPCDDSRCLGVWMATSAEFQIADQTTSETGRDGTPSHSAHGSGGPFVLDNGSFEAGKPTVSGPHAQSTMWRSEARQRHPTPDARRAAFKRSVESATEADARSLGNALFPSGTDTDTAGTGTGSGSTIAGPVRRLDEVRRWDTYLLDDVDLRPSLALEAGLPKSWLARNTRPA